MLSSHLRLLRRVSDTVSAQQFDGVPFSNFLGVSREDAAHLVSSGYLSRFTSMDVPYITITEEGEEALEHAATVERLEKLRKKKLKEN